MSHIKLKRGRVGVRLEEGDREYLLNMLSLGGDTCVTLARKIGISYEQLHRPVIGTRNCSLESHRKITAFLSRERRRGQRQPRENAVV